MLSTYKGKDRFAMREFLFEFLRAGASPWHAAAHAAALLDGAGFTRLEEPAPWALAPGRGYYTVRDGSAVIAWRMPQGEVLGWRITASHADSPAWRLRGTADTACGVYRPGVEGYGGMLMATWFDRPLTVAGRVMVRTAAGLEARPVYLDRDLAVIPSLAVQMDRTANDGHKYDPVQELQPCMGDADACRLPALLAGALGVAEVDIVDSDLYLCVRQAPVRLGADGAWYMAPHIDDLACAAVTLQAFLQAGPTPGDVAPVWMLLNNEEVGSLTAQGAASHFARDVLERTLQASVSGCCANSQGMARALAGSFCLSADNVHALHPAHPEVADPGAPVYLGKGPVLKCSAARTYCTDGASGAVVRELCRRAGVPLQVFTNRPGRRGGSTLGRLLLGSLPVPTADVGMPQWAMHSAVETAALADAEAMGTLVRAYYAAALAPDGRGGWLL